MKKIVLITLMFGAFYSITAQVKTFTEGDLKALTFTASRLIDNEKVRIKTTTVYCENGIENPVMTEKEIRELVPPDLEYSIIETKTAKGIERDEVIYVGEKMYRKQKNGSWKKQSFDTSISTSTGIGVSEKTDSKSEVKVETIIERNMKLGETLNNQLVDYYETIITKKIITQAKTYTNIEKSEYWFSKDGKFIKIEKESQDGENKKTSRTTKEFEYDPKIKIKAPKK